jgi:NitT/TauT family transport system substrate-binding protein
MPFLACDETNGAESLIARPGIETVADLAGKTLALPRGTYLDSMWSVIAARAQLPTGAVATIDVPGEQAVQALESGRADAAFTWEPYAGIGIAAVNGNRPWDSSRIRGLSPAVLAVRRDFAEKRGDDISKIVAVWHRTTEYLRANPDAAYAIVAGVNKKSAAEVREFAKLDRVLDLRDNLSLFAFAPGMESLHGSFRQMADFIHAEGIATGRVDSAAVLNSYWVQQQSARANCTAADPLGGSCN